MNMNDWAKKELDIVLEKARTNDGEDGLEMQTMMNNQVMEIVELFCTHEHSGFSSGVAIGMLVRLLDYKPLTAITGSDDEWGPIDKSWGNTQQNKRCSAIFRKNEDNATANYMYSKIFSDNGGHSWFTNDKSSGQAIFPFVVPNKSQKVYLNGENSDEIITDKEAIKVLYNKSEVDYGPSND
jgi:hypothetical protein